MRLKKRLKRLTTLVEGLEVVINGHSRIIQELNDFRNHTNTRLDNQDGTTDKQEVRIDKLFIQLSKLEKAMSKSSKVKKSRAK